jgi:hypothetical protein
MTHTLPVGTSEPQMFQLRDNGEPLPGTGLTVSFEIFRGVTPVESPPAADWLDQAAGTVVVTGMETLAVGEYRVRYKLTDAEDVIGYVPNGKSADKWIVVRIPNK